MEPGVRGEGMENRQLLAFFLFLREEIRFARRFDNIPDKYKTKTP
jgi:hypothetical protein